MPNKNINLFLVLNDIQKNYGDYTLTMIQINVKNTSVSIFYHYSICNRNAVLHLKKCTLDALSPRPF